MDHNMPTRPATGWQPELDELAERQRIAAMTPEEYARHIGLPEDQVARVMRIAELRGPAPRRTGVRPRPGCNS